MADQFMKRLVGGERPSEQSPVETLSNRELETFELLGHGYTTEQIAAKMHVSPKTIETYRVHIKRKLNVDSLPELMQRAARWVMEEA
jgi:DNA-binding NarL/FixJ family response regulator